MNSNLRFCLSLILFISVHVQARNLDASYWSLRYLARASNLLLASVDGDLDGKAPVCEIKADEAIAMGQKLKILIDEKIKNLSDVSKKRILAAAPICEKECSCDIYALHLETEQVPENQKLLSELTAKASQTTAKGRLACARQFTEFCKSELIKTLRK